MTSVVQESGISQAQSSENRGNLSLGRKEMGTSAGAMAPKGIIWYCHWHRRPERAYNNVSLPDAWFREVPEHSLHILI